MSFSLIGTSIGESATLQLNAMAADLKEKGEPVIHLGGGEPKSKAPNDAIAAAMEMLDSGEIRYTPVGGVRELKQAIIRYTEEFYNHTVAPENVIASSGAKQAIMVALQAIVDPGEEVIFPSPYWVSYPDMIKLAGGAPVAVKPEDGGFQPRLRDIEERVTGYTKCIIINSPNNPSGAVYSEEFIADIVGFCESRGLWLIMDDIYHRLIFDGRKPINPYDFAKDKSESSKLIIVNGVSKQYAMTGYRIGWAVGSCKLIEIMTKIQGHQTSCPSALSQMAAVGAINGSQGSVEDLRKTLENNRDVMVEHLRALDSVKLMPPDGAFYCFADFRAYEEDSAKLAHFLLDKARVVTVPGVEFGWDGYLRLSTCGSAQDIVEGARRIKWALDSDSPREIYIGERKLVRDWS